MIGQVISDRYRVIRKLGGGGMSTVYLAEDTILQRQVAVKAITVPSGEKDATLQRFNREVHNLTQLSHENIVNVYDVTEDGDDHFFIVMEYINGPTLNEYIKQHQPLDINTVINFTEQIINGIEHAHEHRIVNRDVKPQNVLVCEDHTLKVLDFGIAKALSETTMTHTNSVLGTVQYLSPEQARGENTDKTTDVYSIGIVLYELLMGEPPFKGETAISVAIQHIQSAIPNISETREDVPQALSNVVLKATEKDRHDRYQDVADMRSDLQTALDSNHQDDEVYHTDNTQTKTVPLNTGYVNETLSQQTTQIPNTSQSRQDSDTINHQQFQRDEGQFHAVPTKKRSKKKKFFLAFIFLLLVAALVSFAGWGMFGKKYSEAPDVSGHTMSEAKQLLKKHKLKVGKVDHAYSDKYDEDKVISSSPKIGSRVKQGSKVNLTVSKGPEMAEMPNLYNMSKDSAEETLNKLGITHIDFDTAYTKSNVPKGHIESQSVEPGKKVKIHDTEIKLTESLGYKQVKVDDYEGKSVAEATEALEEKGFNVAVSKRYSKKVEKDHVISQSPKNKKVNEGSTVTLVASLGEQPKSKDEDDQDGSDDADKDKDKDKSDNDDTRDKHDKASSSDSDSHHGKTKDYQAKEEVPYSGKKGKSQKVQIFRRDQNSGGTTPYQTYSITSDREVVIPLEIQQGRDAGYTIRVDGRIVADKDIAYDDID